MTAPSPISPLRRLLDVARLARTVEQLPELLDEIARAIAETFGFRTVVIELTTEDAGATHAFPLRHSDGHVLGIVSVAHPVSGRPTTTEEREALAAFVGHAALAVETAQERGAAERDRLALEQLLEVSPSLTVQAGVDATLAVVCSAVRDALGFHAVVASLREPGGLLSVRAAVGWGGDAGPLRYDEVVGFLDAAFAVEGCYLLPSVEAERRLGRAWNRHRLLVPLHDETGEVIGLLWAGDPADGLPVSAARLRALRAFANQAAGAVLAAQSVHELRFLADHDPLTRLLNRRAFVTRLDGEVARATRYGRSFALVLCDLDGFKALNDRLGHPAGDEALTGFARTLLRALRRGDEAFRIGGDEFALLVAEATEQDAREVVQRVAEQPGTFTASFGVALCPEHAADAQTLFRLADAALYHAKRSGSGLQFVA